MFKNFLLMLLVWLIPVYASADLSIVKIKSAPAASYVIAASDSAKKNFADYVCDGTADQVQINTAIVSLFAGGKLGGTIKLLEGSYHINAPIVIPAGITDGSVCIIGQGAVNTTIYLDSGSNTDCVQVQSQIGDFASLIIKNLMINGNSTGNPTGGYGVNDGAGTLNLQDSIYEDVFFDRCRKAAVRLKNAWSTRFNRCIFEYGAAEGIVVEDGEDVDVSTCKFMFNQADAISATCVAMSIQNSRFYQSGASTSAIHLWSGSTLCVVNGNKIRHSQEQGSNIGINSDGDFNTISNNAVENASSTLTAYGIYLGSNSSYNNGSGNTIYLSSTSTPVYNAGTRNSVGIISSSVGNVYVASNPYQMSTLDDTIVGNKSTPFAITLTAQPFIGQKCSVFNYGAGQVTVYGSGSATINGSATKTVAQYAGYDFVYISSNIWISQ